jgi:hypothetical protein
VLVSFRELMNTGEFWNFNVRTHDLVACDHKF